MKIGTEDRKKVIIAVCLLVLALMIAVRGFFSIQSGSNAGPAPTQASGVQPILGRKGPTQLLPENNLDPRLRLDLLQASADVEYKGNGRNIFRIGAEPVKALPQPVKPPMQVINTPPPQPQINMKFFGFATRPGSGRKVFLSQGDDVFVAGEGDIVNRRYRILRIMPTSVEVEDVISNIRQMLPLTQG